MPTNFSQIVQARLLFTKEPSMHHQHLAPYHVRQRQPTRVCVCARARARARPLVFRYALAR